ncbi:beta-ketoacyl synthase N-terminal-like domain-containing protein [Amycolatopsis pithecellobii]|uniref:3-oxoacyl-ACP synthase n=1 Tax=Amycolatopsis pithecellobii TaxID=664692 RepID=A0A6N7YSK8_9PSEU|nr:beta-ketoacyl synthase N-terminal-like domain-containing protein [Amycolatopsis pithecellobii]MTD56015.1 3-oxoacyl-ACP synthase [Amycolatopsis pithecellobii]
MISREIGICGIGAVTGYGWGREVLWDGLSSGKSAATLEGGYGKDRDETAWVAKVPDGGDPIDGRSRFARAMRASAREAIADAERRGWQPGPRVGLLHAVVLGEVDLWREFYHDEQTLKARDYLALMPSTPMSTFMQEYGFHGPAMNVSAMCASGNAGLLTAKAWLDAGIVDDVVFVATDLSLVPENVLHFVRLGVAITDTEPLDACRPFQEGSRGFSMGEAAVSFVLSRNSGRPYALALGGAMSHDAHHVTSIDMGLDQVRGCFRDALANAGVPTSAVRYLNAHGPGTKQCDRAEATMLDELFGAETALYSVKPLVGHCQGAASAVETAVAALGYDRGFLPAPPTVAPGHPQLLNGRTEIEDGLTVKSSLGMGGHNSVVVLAPPA